MKISGKHLWWLGDNKKDNSENNTFDFFFKMEKKWKQIRPLVSAQLNAYLTRVTVICEIDTVPT